MKRVVYTDSEGYKRVVEVPDHYTKDEYDKGIYLGPPDLEELGLYHTTQKKLSNALVDAGLVEPGNLLGNRMKLRQVLVRLQLTELEIPLISIYQRLYKGE
jgi:hypothetical protein